MPLGDGLLRRLAVEQKPVGVAEHVGDGHGKRAKGVHDAGRVRPALRDVTETDDGVDPVARDVVQSGRGADGICVEVRDDR